MNKRIEKVAVLGSGVMGSSIACLFAGAGFKVILFDISPKELTEKEQKKGFQLTDSIVKNRIVLDSLKTVQKASPSPFFHKSHLERITPANYEDDAKKLSQVDWIIEVVIEKLEIKQKVYQLVEKHRKNGTIISSNTSGIPIKQLIKERSEDFQTHFLGTHFFNPPRYLPLLEIIPTDKTKKEVTDFVTHFGEKFLGKTTVVCKDTPAFIANRIGVYSIANIFHLTKKLGLTVSEVDALTGKIIGRQKSATFRTTDIVGLDTLVHVANGIKETCPGDERLADFTLPDFIYKMVENGLIGEKAKKGFYQKIKSKEGKSIIKQLNLSTLEFEDSEKPKIKTLGEAKNLPLLSQRIGFLLKDNSKIGEFYRKHFAAIFAYVAHRVPEITDEFYKIDEAIKTGFGWKLGPFEIWDAIGVENGIELIQNEGFVVADWVLKMVNENEAKSFYSKKSSVLYFFNSQKSDYSKIPSLGDYIILSNLSESKTVWQNSGTKITDIGDGIINVEFKSKMNTMGSEVLQGINKALDLGETEFDGVVIGNEGSNFSVGANLMMVFMFSAEQEYDELNFAVKYFQDTMMRVRYSNCPVVVAPHHMTFGGACELTLHADAVVALAETYIGMVEFGVGFIPAGGGSKEMALLSGAQYRKGDVEINTLRDYFMTIAMAKVSGSAFEAFDLDILKKGRDQIVFNQKEQIIQAKNYAKLLANKGYTKPISSPVRVLGKSVLGALSVSIESMREGNFISDHDKKIAKKLGYVMAGGELSEPSYVSEQYLLDLEREAFLSLCSEQKTLERIQHMLNKGKALRN